MTIILNTPTRGKQFGKFKKNHFVALKITMEALHHFVAIPVLPSLSSSHVKIDVSRREMFVPETI